MAKIERLFRARFFSGCIPEEEVDAWIKDLNDWVDGKFSRGLCGPGCDYQRFSRKRVLNEACPDGQVSIRLSMRGFCVCPDDEGD